MPLPSDNPYERLAEIRTALQQIVCTEGSDAGVVLLSNDSPSEWDEKLQCHVYKHDYFSPLGDALIALWQLAQLEPPA